MTGPHLTGWCSPWCSPRTHATCQDRLERGQLPHGCACPKHPHNEKEDAG